MKGRGVLLLGQGLNIGHMLEFPKSLYTPDASL